MRSKWLLLILSLSLGILCAPVWAEEPEEATSESKTKRYRWGLRVGLADDPDQVVGGALFDLGDIVENLRFQPTVELGLGDDHRILDFTAPVHYRFKVDATVTPYAGGGVALGFVEKDTPSGDDTDFEVAFKAIGGVEWELKSGRLFALELDLVFGDLHDVAVLAGWTF